MIVCVNSSEHRVWDVVVSETYRDRISAGDRYAGQCHVQAKQSGCTGQQVGAADIGNKPDAHFRHGDLGGVGDHTNACVCTEPDTTAHHDAVHKRHDRFRVLRDLSIEPVLVVPELTCLCAISARAVIYRHDVAAGAESTLAGPRQHDPLHAFRRVPTPIRLL